MEPVFPRSPRIKFAGLVHLARMLDKARAYVKSTLGEYIYPCPMDDAVLEFLQTDHESLAKIASERTDPEIESWIKELCRSRSPEEIETMNLQMLSRSPEPGEKLEYFIEQRNKIDPSRSDVTTWVDLIDLDEGRLQ
jgi:hypothetical protein